ncbi:MAG: lysophospholipase [Oscillospiraceae bacterium]|nr:lysophospholipase [Oscillospiraceae bacterium]
MKRILCIGDSNTWGYDPRSYYGSRYPGDVRWTGLLKQTGWDVLNFGENGMSVPGEYEYNRIGKCLQSSLPVTVISMMLGSNDILNGATAEQTAKKMERFLHLLKETVSDTAVILVAPPAMKQGTWVQSPAMTTESEKLAEMYRKLSEKENVQFADAERWNVELTFDGVHFSPIGHSRFADCFSHYMEAHFFLRAQTLLSVKVETL